MSGADKQTEKIGRKADGTFAPGNNLGPGRPKGSKDKFTSLKDAFMNAFNELGGEDELVKWAGKNDRNKAQFFQMITKMLPSSIDMDVKGQITAIIISDQYLPKDQNGAKSQ